MMKSLLSALLAFALLAAPPAPGADEPARDRMQSPTAATCPAPQDTTRQEVAGVSQADCCKGHKGVCGCRAGKIVCCDNTTSPSCACHADWHEVN